MVDLDRHGVIDLITVGRVSGRPHTIEIWFAHHEATIYMLSGGGDRSDWVRNIIANQAVTVSVGGSDFVGRGRIVVDPGEQQLARNTVFTKYTKSYGGDLARWRETALPVAVDIDAARRSGFEEIFLMSPRINAPQGRFDIGGS